MSLTNQEASQSRLVIVQIQHLATWDFTLTAVSPRFVKNDRNKEGKASFCHPLRVADKSFVALKIKRPSKGLLQIEVFILLSKGFKAERAWGKNGEFAFLFFPLLSIKVIASMRARAWNNVRTNVPCRPAQWVMASAQRSGAHLFLERKHRRLAYEILRSRPLLSVLWFIYLFYLLCSPTRKGGDSKLKLGCCYIKNKAGIFRLAWISWVLSTTSVKN